MIKCNEICNFKGENICCSECGDNETCSNICGLECSTCGKAIIADDAGLEEFRDNNYVLFKNIFNICEQKKSLEIEEKKMKEELKKSMELYNIKSFDNDILKMTYIEASTTTTIDSKKLKEKYPEIYSDCSKISNKKTYIKISLK